MKNNNDYITTKYVECSCHSSDHTLRLVRCYDKKEKENDLYIEVQLINTNNIFVRIWRAICYVFGHESRYGHWDCFLFDKKNSKYMIEILGAYLHGFEVIEKSDVKEVEPIVETKIEQVVYCPSCNNRQKWDGDHIVFCDECNFEFKVK